MAFPMNQLGRDMAGVAPIVDPEADDLPVPPARGDEDEESTADMSVQEQPDGSALVMMDEDDELAQTQFGDNLADVFDRNYLDGLGRELVECVESDIRVRKERDKQYAEGIKRTGLGNEAPGGADFDGASRVVHPMLSKGCVDFGSRSMKELYPASGPCKTQIIGDATDAKIERAERKKQYMNWQLTTNVPENRTEFERLLSQLPLGGSQYKRWWWDAAMGRPRTETVYIDDVFIPYGQEFWTADRITHRQYITREAYESRIAQGLYCDYDLGSPPAGIDDKSASKQATDKVEGAQEDSQAYSDDGLREIYQVEANLPCDLDSYTDGQIAPYIIHIDQWSQRVLGMFRNWPEGDERRGKKHWMTEYTFIPWRGGPGIGLAHLIGSLAASGTGAVRAILDAAHIQNFPGALKLKGGRNSGQSVQVGPGELTEIECPPNVDDIRKLVMAFPFNGPNTVLFQLLEWLTQQAESVVTTASERIAEGGGANMPVGTAMALIESDSSNFLAIHARMHASLKQELAILHRLNAENLSDQEVVEELGELLVSRADFEGPMDIIPVSDPNIFSEAQRFAQLQSVLQLSSDPRFDQFFKTGRLLQRALKLLQLPAADELLNLPADAKKLGPLEENYVSSLSDPCQLKAYSDQDDLIHLQAHIHYMTSPMFGSSPLIGPKALPILVDHCKEHLLSLYKKHTRAATDAIVLIAKTQGMQITQEDAEARGAAFADGALAQVLGPMVQPGLQAAMQTMQKMTPKPPVDPNIQAHEDGETQRLQMKLQADQQQTGAEAQENQRASQLAAQSEAMQNATNERIAQLTAQIELIHQDRENQNKVVLAEIQGQNEQALARLQAVLKAQLEMLPDYSQQIGALDQRTGQITSALGQQISDLQNQNAKDKAEIVQLVQALSQTVSTPFWKR